MPEKIGKAGAIMKKTITLRLPVWSILAIILCLVLCLGALFLNQENIKDTLRLCALKPEGITSVYIMGTGNAAFAQQALTREDIARVTQIVRTVRLSGKPYQLNPIGGGQSKYLFILEDGTQLHFFCMLASNGYYYCLNDRYYYIGDIEENPDLTVWDQLQALYEQQCQAYFPQ